MRRRAEYDCDVIRVLFQAVYSVSYEDRLWHEEVAAWEQHILPENLMFFWPCIMNWLYINYQLDALIIIYS